MTGLLQETTSGEFYVRILYGSEKESKLEAPSSSVLLWRLDGWEHKAILLVQKSDLLLQGQNPLRLELDQLSDLLFCHDVCFPRALEGIALLKESISLLEASFQMCNFSVLMYGLGVLALWSA